MCVCLTLPFSRYPSPLPRGRQLCVGLAGAAADCSILPWSPAPGTSAATTLTPAQLAPVPDGAAVCVRLRAVNGVGLASAPADGAPVTLLRTPGLALAPPAVTCVPCYTLPPAGNATEAAAAAPEFMLATGGDAARAVLTVPAELGGVVWLGGVPPPNVTLDGSADVPLPRAAAVVMVVARAVGDGDAAVDGTLPLHEQVGGVRVCGPWVPQPSTSEEDSAVVLRALPFLRAAILSPLHPPVPCKPPSP
jgi:hypothetical protein